jgi:hypothetical protein
VSSPLTFKAYLGLPFVITCTAFDPDHSSGVGLSVFWTQLSGPGTATFSSPIVLAPTITAPAPGTYVFQITVSDEITPVSMQFIVNVLPLFTASVPYTAYCDPGTSGTPATITGLASSATSLSDATSKASTAAETAAEAALVCTTFLPVPDIQINIFGVTQLFPSATSIQLSYLSAGTLAHPITETVLQVLNVIPTTSNPLSVVNDVVCNPANLLFPYGSGNASSISDLLSTLTGPINLILRAGTPGNFSNPIPLNLDSAPAGVSIGSLAAGNGVAAAPNAVLTLPSPDPGVVEVSVQQAIFIGFDTSNWQPSASPATYLLIYTPQGSLNNPTGLATVAAIPMGDPMVPPLAVVQPIDTLLQESTLNSPLFLAFFAATYDSGTNVYTPIPNSIQFTANSVFSASASSPPGANNPFSILSLSGVPSLNIPAASSGVLFFPNPSYVRIVAGMSMIS